MKAYHFRIEAYRFLSLSPTACHMVPIEHITEAENQSFGYRERIEVVSSYL